MTAPTALEVLFNHLTDRGYPVPYLLMPHRVAGGRQGLPSPAQ